MERLELVNVPVKVAATTSPAYYAAIEAEARQKLDLKGLIMGGTKYGKAWVDQEMAGMEQTFGDVYARVQVEGGKMVLRASGTIAVVGRPLQTYLIRLADGRITEIVGGGDRGQ